QAGVRLDLSNGRGDLFHVFAGTEQHGLGEPDGLAAKLVIHRTEVAFLPTRDVGRRKHTLPGAGVERSLEQRLLVQGRVSARARNALSLERFKKAFARQVSESRGV